MASTTIQTNNKAIAFRRRAITSYVRENLFGKLMGADSNSIIVKMMETSRGRSGEQLNIPITAPLVGPGVGTSTLVGNEETMDNYGQRVWIDWARNGTLLAKNEDLKSSFDIDQQMVPELTTWGKALLRDEMVLTLASVPQEAPQPNLGVGPGVRVNGLVMAPIPTGGISRFIPSPANIASAAQLNTWHTNNSDRLVYGSTDARYVAGNHAASLAGLIAGTDGMTVAVAKRMRDKAMLPTPLVTSQAPGTPVRPYRTNDTKEYFMMFLGQRAFNALADDPVMVNANRDARPREVGSNPLFQSGDLIYDGIVFRRIPEITSLASRPGAGSGGANVEPVFLCGASAMGLAYGNMPEITNRVETDYGFVKGRGFEACYGTAKIARRSVTWGSNLFKDMNIVTGFVAVT